MKVGEGDVRAVLCSCDDRADDDAYDHPECHDDEHVDEFAIVHGFLLGLLTFVVLMLPR